MSSLDQALSILLATRQQLQRRRARRAIAIVNRQIAALKRFKRTAA